MDRQRTIHGEVQAAAKRVLEVLGSTIGPADTEHSIADRATSLLLEQGIRDTWYYQCTAFVLLGSRSTLSVSGRQYKPAEELVGQHNLVTVDLSPCREGVWGDCARSFPIEQGRYILNPSDPELVEGLRIENTLHELLMSYAKPSTTFSDLHAEASRCLSTLGWENLDKGHNFGHSISDHLDGRIYITSENARHLGDVEYFTFEPHIRGPGGRWGFKHEDIYYFDSQGRACAL